MLIYAAAISPRLQYITAYICKELLTERFELTTDKQKFISHSGSKINYSNEVLSEDEFRIGNVFLLFDNQIKPQEIECFEWSGHKVFFKAEGHLPFDLFSACFYLLSRYEEYLPHESDEYGRYAHWNSLAYQESFLNKPVVDIWLDELKKMLQQQFPSLKIRKSEFRFTPTYDIDHAWAYLYKGVKRNIGGSLRDLVVGRWRSVLRRISVLSGLKQDPFDAYEWLDNLHSKFDLQPYYFFLVAEKNNRFDKNIPIEKREMQELILSHVKEYRVGVHPSWQSGDNTLKIKNETISLGKITGEKIVSSRQHYIRFSLPDTYRHLMEAGIESDFSMGYGSINGFRASTSNSFFWYDLENERQTELLVTPFCFMDANAYYEQKHTASEALAEMREYHQVIKSVNGHMVTVWHNTFLGTHPQFQGWRDVYETFIREIM